MNPVDISVVVCTYNRAEMLRTALASLFDLHTGGQFTYEVLVIDNNSSDNTPAVIAAAASASQAPLRGIRETRQGISPARNRGVRESLGRWVAFFDDDQLADHRWLFELFEFARQRSLRCVGGAVRLKRPEGCQRKLAPTVRMLLGESLWSREPQPYVGRLNPGCGNLLLENSLFAEVGDFDESFARGEDTDLFRRLRSAGVESWYVPAALVDHLTPDERLTESYLFRLAERMGESVAQQQAADQSRLRFAATWLAKAARAYLGYAPLALASAALGDQEAALGRRCQLAISRGFLRAGRMHRPAASAQSAPAASPARLGVQLRTGN